MKPVWWMVSACGVSVALAALLLEARAAVDVLYGMLGPLAMAVASWVLMERAARQSPQRLTAVMIAAFAAKVVFFGVYVVVMVAVLASRPATFVASFTTYFLALYAIEAICLRRLVAAGPRAAS
jgi:hypothetical protein